MHGALSWFIDCPWFSSIDFNTDNALACGSDFINVSVNTINDDNAQYISNYYINTILVRDEW